MTKIVLVLTGEGSATKFGRYSAGLVLSAMTVKHFHPNVPVVCAGDDYAGRLLGAKISHLANLVDRFIPCSDAGGGPIHRSRVIKTSLRRRVEGPFVYLDTDTALVADIAPLLSCESPIGLTLDSWFPGAAGKFPQWCHGVYRDLGWSYPTSAYYNSGVMFAGDSHETAALFREWHERYTRSVALGINLDQPAFNSAMQHLKTRAEIFSEDYNFFCGRYPRTISPSVRVLHVCCSLPATTIPAYEDAVRTLQDGGKVDVAALISSLKATRTQVLRRWHLLWDLQRRAREFAQRKLLRMGWGSARKH